MQANETSSTLQFGDTASIAPAERPLGRAIKRGMLNRCPACGTGRLFRSFLKPVDNCAACGEDYTHQRADDLPPYLVITIVGHIVVGGYMMTDLVWPLTTWQHLAIWTPITLILALLMMQPVKGGVIGLQWAAKMHGFNDKPAEAEATPAYGDRTA
ncbi:MAG TPA: DUF983 domain-containing protein [Shinella sp.]|jgi:uncharacterized protein (DUF983 family)|uniref:DUF983 domain-containing protein n=1 Tax=Shinella sp. TaxID=1870904 RepID=UPI002E0F7A7F|nr:DUF983 domain-containing protein [Shinella sp.]